MALPKYTETRYRIWHYFYIAICTFVFIFLIAPLFVIFPLSFNAEEFLVFSEGMKNLDPDAFSLRWYKDMVYGTKNPWGLAAKNSFIIAIFATLGSVILGTVAALGLAIVFGLMGVINLAHGELMMLGAYTTYVTQLIFKLPILKPFYNSYIIVSIFLAFIVSGVVGILLEKTIIKKLYGSPLETLLATWGVSLILQQFVRSVPLAYGTGLVISLLIGLFLPTTFPSKIKESINFKYFKFSSWIFAALTGVLQVA